MDAPHRHGIVVRAKVEVLNNHLDREGHPNEHYDVGIDLAKNVFQVHGVDERGRAVLRKAVKRADLTRVFAQLPTCLIGMEACGSTHYWARRLMELVTR